MLLYLIDSDGTVRSALPDVPLENAAAQSGGAAFAGEVAGVQLEQAPDGLRSVLVLQGTAGARFAELPTSGLLDASPVVRTAAGYVLTLHQDGELPSAWLYGPESETWSRLLPAGTRAASILPSSNADTPQLVVAQDRFAAGARQATDLTAPVALVDVTAAEPAAVELLRRGMVARDAAVSPDGSRIAVIFEPAGWRPGVFPDTARFRVSFAATSEVLAGEPSWSDVELTGLDTVTATSWSSPQRRGLNWAPGQMVLLADEAVIRFALPPTE